MLDELKLMGVLTEVNEPTAWCSPTFWVPKLDNVRVRLVTDFTNLNRVVKQLIHTFPNTTEILQAIPADARVFAKLNAVFPTGSRQKEVHADYTSAAMGPIGTLHNFTKPIQRQQCLASLL